MLLACGSSERSMSIYPKRDPHHERKCEYVEAVYMGEEDFCAYQGRTGVSILLPHLFRCAPPESPKRDLKAATPELHDWGQHDWQRQDDVDTLLPDEVDTMLPETIGPWSHKYPPSPNIDVGRSMASLLWSPAHSPPKLRNIIDLTMSSPVAGSAMELTPPAKRRRSSPCQSRTPSIFDM